MYPIKFVNLMGKQNKMQKIKKYSKYIYKENLQLNSKT